MTLDVRELLRRIGAGETDRAIARDLGMARKTVAKYRTWASGQPSLTDGLPDAGDLDLLLRATRPAQPPRAAFVAAPYEDLIREWRTKGVSPMAIYQRLRDGHGYDRSYSALYRFVVHLEGQTPEAFVRLEVDPGEEAQVDFGSAGTMVDPTTGEVRKAWVFVMTLSHSRHQYATFVFDQKIATWLRCHREAFEAFGGVPRRVVVDNLKAAIVRAVLHDPVAQRSYREFAEHTGFLIAPCRPRTPRHKGKVESGVKYVKRNFLPGRSFRDLTHANAELADWVERIAGTRVHGTTKQRPLARFLEVESAALLPLPAAPYDLGIWKQAKLHPDCHVVVDGAYYSAPHRFVGQRLWVRTNGRDVVLFHDYERVATHAWGPPGTRRTNPDHYPPEKVAYLLATPVFCRRRAEGIGPSTAAVIATLLDERPLDRLRTVQAILRLADKFGPRRLEAACRRARCFGEAGYTTIKRILLKGIENDPLPGEEPASLPCRSYVFARPGSEIFFNEGGPDHGCQAPVDPQAQGVAPLGDPRHLGRA